MGAPDQSLVDPAKGVWPTHCADHTRVGDVCQAIVSSRGYYPGASDSYIVTLEIFL
jgi:hypothetical protein